MRLIFASLIFTFVLGCATPYQQAGDSTWSPGGYDTQNLGNDIFLISIRGNIFTEKTTAIEYFHRRAAEITRTKGYRRYEVIEMYDPDEKGIVYIDNKPYFLKAPRVVGRIKCFKETSTAQLPPPAPKQTSITSGTGWPLRNGTVVTNYHVVAGSNSVALRIADGTWIEVTVILRDKENDIALLRPHQLDLLPPAIPLAHRSAGLGAEVFTIGYPKIGEIGISPKLTNGTITSTTGFEDDPRKYQISAQLHGGNSGGPLLNLKGEAVGIVVSKLSGRFASGEIAQNINYAIKIGYLKVLLDPTANPTHKELKPKLGSLENLATRITPSVMIILAGSQGALSDYLKPASPTTKTVINTESSPTEDTTTNLFEYLRKFESLTSHDIKTLNSEQVNRLANALQVSPSAIKAFRWGRSGAPKGHPRSGLT